MEEKKELPSLDLAAARYKQAIAKLSKRELVRQNAYYYARLTLANLELNDMESQIKNLSSELTELKQSKESHE